MISLDLFRGSSRSIKILIQLRALSFLLLFGFAQILILNCSDSNSGKDAQVSANDSSEEESSRTSSYQKTIVFFGDSLTAGLGLLSQDDAWPALVGDRLKSEGYEYEIINAGLSGDTTSGGLSRLDWALRIKPSVFVLELGANDSMRGVPIATIRNNLTQIIKTVQEKSPDTKILLVGMKTFPNLGAVYRKQFDNLYPEIAREFSLPLVPFILEGIAGDRKLNQKDGIHPTEDGHRIMAENIYPYVKKLL